MGGCEFSLQVMSDHKARSKRANDSLKTTHMKTVPNKNTGQGEGGARVSEVTKRSQGQGSEACYRQGDGRRCGQMSKLIGIRPDKLQLGYQLLL